MVYRPSGPSTYKLVPESKRRVNLTMKCPSRRSEEFNCREEILLPAEQFTIQQNDIVAACLMEAPATYPIRVLGIDAQRVSVIRGSVYEFGDHSFQQCTMSQLDVLDIKSKNIVLEPNGILHVYADINGK